MAIPGSDSLEVPTIYKAYCSGLSFREYPQKNMAQNMLLTYLHLLDPTEISHGRSSWAPRNMRARFRTHRLLGNQKKGSNVFKVNKQGITIWYNQSIWCKVTNIYIYPKGSWVPPYEGSDPPHEGSDPGPSWREFGTLRKSTRRSHRVQKGPTMSRGQFLTHLAVLFMVLSLNVLLLWHLILLPLLKWLRTSA